MTSSVFSRVRGCFEPLRALPSCLFFILVGCDDNDAAADKSAPAPQSVVIQTLTSAHQATRLEVVGTARAKRSVTLYPEVAGIVQAVQFRAGQQVEQGQLLLVLDAREETLAVELAEVAVKDARRQYQRYSESAKAGAVTPAQLDDSAILLERAELNLRQAQTRLDYHTVRAPFAGVMGLTELDPGARVDTSTAIASLDDSSQLWVRFPVPELFLGQIEAGDDVELTTWSGGDQTVSATVIDLDSRVDPATRTFDVRVALDQTAGLRPGQSFRVVVNLTGGRYPVVPEVALQWGGDGAYVWAVEQGRARRVPVAVVQRRKGEILVDGKFAEGAQVVAEGIQRMREGVAVKNMDGQFLEAGLEATLMAPVIKVN